MMFITLVKLSNRTEEKATSCPLWKQVGGVTQYFAIQNNSGMAVYTSPQMFVEKKYVYKHFSN